MKVLDASCSGNKVMCQGVEITPVVILSQGVGASTGTLFVDEDRCYYVAKATPDLESLLTDLIAALNQVATGLNQTAAGMIAGSPLSTSAAIAAAATQVTAKVSSLTTLKGNLK